MTATERARVAQRAWQAVPLYQRAQRLSRLVDTLAQRIDAIADVIQAETGKARVEAIGHDIGGAIQAVQFLVRSGPKVLQSRHSGLSWMPHRHLRIDRVPLGVVLVISPWNFPLSIPLGQVAAALMAGNGVVLKPSEVTPRTGALIAELLGPCDLPDGLFQVQQGDGAVGAALIADRPDKVCFTGSLATGRRVMATCAAHPIPVDLELGGVDALIVLDDADLDLATSAALWGATFNGGQVCASVERLIVHERVADAFVARLLAKTAQLDPERDLGPVILKRQRAVYDRHVADAHERGLDVLCGGVALPSGPFAPTFVAGAGVEAALVCREETFGPLAALRTFTTDAEAIAQHNAHPAGLTASVFSRDLARATAVGEALAVGLVSVNDVAASLHAFGEVPWSGVGESGFGCSHGEEGLRAMTRPRVLDLPRRGTPGFKRPWWYPYDVDQLDMITAFTRLTAGHGLRHAAAAGRSALRSLRHAPRF